MVCFAPQGAVVVPTINSTCLAAGPGPGGVSPTLRGKGLGSPESVILVGKREGGF